MSSGFLALRRLERFLDLSETPPAARFEIGRDGIIYLYEVLSRIELPPEADIPDVAAYADEEDDKEAGDKSVSWTIPHTEITLVRVADGPRDDEFLFSSSTVTRAREFYEKARTQPYRRNVPLKNYAEMRPYLSIGGWMISSRTIEGFPDWLKRSVHQQAVWKWIALALAAQPTIENFIGGLNLFADRPVRVGDFCRYGEDPTSDWWRIGTVESIGLRSTKIRGIDDAVTTIPNADFSKMHIVSYTLRRRMAVLTVLGLRYETTDDQLRFVLAALRDMLPAHPRVLDEEPRVRFAGFGECSLNVEIRVNIYTSNRDQFRAIREDIYLRVMKIVKNAGTGFAFPSRTVYHTRDDGFDAERQQAAEAQVVAWCSAQELPFPTFTADYRKKTRNTLVVRQHNINGFRATPRRHYKAQPAGKG